MARKVVTIVKVTDDIDGAELADEDARTLQYVWGGKSYELDVSEAHAQELNARMGMIIAVSREVKPTLPRKRSHRALAATPRQTPQVPAERREIERAGEIPRNSLSWKENQARTAQLKEIRAWARKHGWPDQASSGRLQEGVREAYYTANPEAPRA